MAETRSGFLQSLLAPKIVRAGLILWILFSGYDTVSSQLELPTVRALLGMSGSLLPWWGWLLVLQAILGYALFEYVRRNIASPTPAPESGPPALPDNEMESRLARLEHNHGNLRDNHVTKIQADNEALKSRLDEMEKDLKPLVAKQRADIKASIVEAMESLRIPRPKRGDKWRSMLHSNKLKALDRFPEARLAAAGVSPALFHRAIEGQRKRVETDPAYFVLEPGEEEIWADGHSKRAWYVHLARVEAVLRVLKGEQS